MNPRLLGMLVGALVVAGMVLYFMSSKSSSATSGARAGSGSAVVVPVGTSSSSSSSSPGGTGTAPALPPSGDGSAQNPKDYMVGDVRVRDHREGNNKPLDIPPNIHPADQRELPSSLTHDISQQVRKLLYTCAADLPKDARGTKPRLEGQLTVAIKDHTLSITNAVAQIRDVDGPSQDAIKQCVEQKSVGMTAAASDQADIDNYGIQITFAIP